MISIAELSLLQNDKNAVIAIIQSLNIPSYNLDDSALNIQHYLKNLRPEISIIIEDNYIDKVYRDEYYTYFSTKLYPYKRDCVKLSFIDLKIEKDMLLNPAALENIKDAYLGFMILRPIFPGIVGRTALSPTALQSPSSDIRICKAPIKNSIIGQDVTIRAFPHSSQDTELMTCAETTIWSLMEYFGNKYPEYSPILPSKIHKILDLKAYQRHIPSEGLLYTDISYVLQSNSFGCKVYSRRTYSEDAFKRIISSYIESGVPLGVAITGMHNGKRIGHAVVCIGRKHIPQNKIDTLPSKSFTKNPVRYKIWNDCIDEFVFNDDNNPCYQIADISHPTPQYPACSVSDIVVPLYHKIYFDAPKALNFSEQICDLLFSAHLPDGCVLRTYLASSHSYRNHIIKDSLLDRAYKQFILDYIKLPKFVWVTEISSYDNFINKNVNGIILLDATETRTDSFRPLIFGCFDAFNIIYDNTRLKIRQNSLSLQFNCKTYTRNLE